VGAESSRCRSRVSSGDFGLILANSGKVNTRLTGVNGNHWTSMALLGAVLFWNNFQSRSGSRLFFRVLRAAGLVLLVVMLAIFRRSSSSGLAAWLDLSYWESSDDRLDLPECLPALHPHQAMAVDAGCMVQWIDGVEYSLLRSLDHLCLPGAFYLCRSRVCGCIHCHGGVISSLVFLTMSLRWIAGKNNCGVVFCGAALRRRMVGHAAWNLEGSRDPTWCLSAVEQHLYFLALYWVCDVLKQVRWAKFALPAGSNTLLTYLLPPCARRLLAGGCLPNGIMDGWA